MAKAFLNGDEAGLLDGWMRDHPDGFCGELPASGRDPRLHRIGCPHLGVAGVDWSPIPVVCYDTEDDLVAWQWEHDQLGLSRDYVDRLQCCDVCRPDR